MVEFNPETWKWLAQQGVLGIVLLLVLVDYKRTYQRLVAKLDEDKEQLKAFNTNLMNVLKENTESNTELRTSVERWSRVTEEAFPRGGRRVSDLT